MSNKLIDLTGKVFGKLTVLNIAEPNKHKQRTWDCICECGNKTNVIGQQLRIGRTKSCGCGQITTKHGMAGTPIYKVWSAMVQRTTNPKNENYSEYSKRGICNSWLNFENFYSDMGDANGLTLERVNNSKGYDKENCIWADRKTQANNLSNNVIATIDGESKSIGLWSEISGIPIDIVRRRMKDGWEHEKAVFSKVQETKTADKFVRSVAQFDKDGNKVGEYGSITLATKETGISTTGISYSANGTRKTAGGFIWKFT